MNKYEQQATRRRGSAVRSSMTLWSAGVALVGVIVLILGLSSSAPSSFFVRGGVAVAVLLLLFRQIGSRMKGRTPRAAQPDPQSKLNLD